MHPEPSLAREKDMSGKARDEFSAFVPDGDMGQFAQLVSKFFDKYH